MPVTVTISGETGTEVLGLMREFVRPVGNGPDGYAKPVTAPASEGPGTFAQAEPALVGDDTSVGSAKFAEQGNVEVDSAGVPFDPEVHTGTKLKDGTWRAKKGMADKAAELAAAAEPEPEETSQSVDDAGTDNASDVQESSDEEDEFAAFANAGTAVEQPVVPARTWTDADIASLINQAANKIGASRVEEIKAVIANYTPKGVVPHSRHVPVDRREDFARAIEELAEIEFAG